MLSSPGIPLTSLRQIHLTQVSEQPTSQQAHTKFQSDDLLIPTLTNPPFLIMYTAGTYLREGLKLLLHKGHHLRSMDQEQAKCLVTGKQDAWSTHNAACVMCT